MSETHRAPPHCKNHTDDNPGDNPGDNSFVTSAQATLHCLSGCVVGEALGLMIAISLGFGVWATIFLATGLAYVSGFSLGLLPVMRKQNKSFFEALKLIWFGEAVSIGVMEIAMNGADFYAGGMQSGSLFSATFWIALLVAIPAGFLAAWPVNWWLLSRNYKKCH
jgi:hypothetical protein